MNHIKLAIILSLILALWWKPALPDSPGLTLGHTARDMQSVGATNHRCAADGLGGFHAAWTEGDLPDRHVYYNFVDEDGNIQFGEGTIVNSVSGAGYPTVVANDNNAAVIAFHNFSNMIITLGVDAGQGLGLFTLHDPPDAVPGGGSTFWPRVGIDASQRCHILSIEHGMGDIAVPMIYSHSGDNYDDWIGPELIDTITVQAYMVAASKYTDKVALVYAKPRRLDDPDYYNNDVVYIESEDGVTWDFDNKVNITNYQQTDTLRCFNSLDAVYDPDGNLHIVWTTPFYDEFSHWASTDSCYLWHWSEDKGAAVITDGLNPSNPGTWDLSISGCNISVNSQGDLYVSYCRYNDVDISSAGYSNGDIYYTFSLDGGEFWFPDENLTDSQTPGCLAGDCDSDAQLSAAQYADDALHLFYVNDKDAGMASADEGEFTINPLNYLKLDFETDVDEDGGRYIPGTFYLSPAYPNPFNAAARIGYDIAQAGIVRLEVFNLRGQAVATLTNEFHSPGHYTADFHAENLASGIYYARLSSGDRSLVRKLTLLK